MPKYPIYTETQARELLRYLPEGTGYWKEPAAFHNPKFSESPTACYVRIVAEGEVRGYLPPGSTAAIAGMVAGKHAVVVVGPGDDLDTIRDPHTGEKPTHLLIEVSK